MGQDVPFREFLLHHRRAAGLTQEELAERANLSVRAISDLERGLRTVPQRETIELLAQALELPPEQVEAAVQRRRGPPARSIRPRHPLPLPLTPLLGREQEKAVAVRLLQSEEVRMLTLIGPGGVGKTRLALQAAAELEGHFRDGVVLVELAPISEMQFVLPAIATALGVPESGRIPLVESVTASLHGSMVLLVLDNCEHLLDAGLLMVDLLRACPGLSVLATSREPFHLRGEHRLDVLPLPVPERVDALTPEELALFPSVELFLQRTRAIEPTLILDDDGHRAVAEICQRLDGLPLAIELAASRIRLFAPRTLLGRLSQPLPLLTGGSRDAPPRHQTLRETIEWSYRLLSPDEQRLFARLSVFAGGWTAEAAEAVCVTDDALDILEGLGSLLDKSLVRQKERDEGRFSMLDTIREYARECFEAVGEESIVCRRHAEYFLVMACEAEMDLPGHDQVGWLQRLNRELDNLRIALAWWRDNGEIENALRLVGALQWFWYDGGHGSEGYNWLESLLALDTRASHTPGRAAALAVLGGFYRSQSNFDVGRAFLEESLSIWRELGDTRGMGRALGELAPVIAAQGDVAGARTLCEESLVLAREAGDHSYVALALHSLSILDSQEGRESEARSRSEESRAVWQQLGNRGMQSLVSNFLGDLARSKGKFSEAAAYYQESLELAEDAATRQMQAIYHHNLAHATHRLGDDTQARRQFTEALTRFREIGDRRGVIECVAGLASLFAVSDPDQTARLFGAAEALVDASGSQLNPSNQSDYDYALAVARARLGDHAFDSARAEGHSMTLEQAIADGVLEPEPNE